MPCWHLWFALKRNVGKPSALWCIYSVSMSNEVTVSHQHGQQVKAGFNQASSEPSLSSLKWLWMTRKTKKWGPASQEFTAVVVWKVSQCRPYRKNEERQEPHCDNKLLCACVLFNLVLPEGVRGTVPHIWCSLFEYLAYLLIVMPEFQWQSPLLSLLLVLYKPLNICRSTGLSVHEYDIPEVAVEPKQPYST